MHNPEVALELAQRNQVVVAATGTPMAAGGWRGCTKSAWCDRENRHRGICNRKATVPGLRAYGGTSEAVAPPATPPSLPSPLLPVPPSEPLADAGVSVTATAAASSPRVGCGGPGISSLKRPREDDGGEGVEADPATLPDQRMVSAARQRVPSDVEDACMEQGPAAPRQQECRALAGACAGSCALEWVVALVPQWSCSGVPCLAV